MHPYLTKLGIRPDVQFFFQPYFNSDSIGNLVFNYHDSFEHFGFAFHRAPDSEYLWLAGNTNFHQVRQVFICGSAMDAICFLNFNYSHFRHTHNLIFLSTGIKPNGEQVRWINETLNDKSFILVFADDLLGRVCDLKVAAGIRRLPITVSITGEQVVVTFRLRVFTFSFDLFSLNAFEKASGFRFNIRTMKPKNAVTYFSLLNKKIFNNQS
ncbi:hypothetical protein HDF18_13180 [Mucilaginibacter sp. X5P1]|uniref:hypothetical protein n=1 Tax=Mucilaginibacter sp. X5P1 TaxID=2723088 RepID=UPI00161F5988|nr:hypothetical protein [Mucilaginibacter sp. X5P1]MBB6141706.1 hypothetical protein [Mucilaginibacter sp. X5P1]